MNGKYLLDTNIVIALFAGDPDVTDRIAGVEDIFIPAVVIGELLYGANKSGRPAENTERIEKFVSDKEGEKKGKIEVAKVMKQEEISMTIIAKTSGLSIEEIKEL